MYSKFVQLDKEKKNRIINAGFKEFAFNGYDKGSTNKIVKEANISKGLIFHYFGSKENYYFFLVDYSCEFILEELNHKVDKTITDFFRVIEEYMVHKIMIFEEYPALFDFMKSFMQEQNPEISEKIWDKLKGLDTEKFDILKMIDKNLFKDGIDVDMAIFTVMSTLEKISYNGFDELDYKIEEITKEIRKYLDFYRTIFY